MKTEKIFLTTLLLVMLAGCGERVTETGADGLEPVSSIVIESNDRMRFVPNTFAVKAGDEITLVLRNTGKMPKETMGHNLVVIDKSVAAGTFSAASISHPGTEYIAPEFSDQVIAATRVLGPGEEQSITFRAPVVPGEYPFACTFPGHTPAGMRGIMVVK